MIKIHKNIEIWNYEKYGFFLFLVQHLTSFSGPRSPKRVVRSLVTIQGTLDTWFYDLRGTVGPFLHFFGTKKIKFFWAKNIQKCWWLRFQILNNFQKSSGIRGGLPYLNFMILPIFWNFTTAVHFFFGPYQTGSKPTKMSKSAWKSQNFANLSVLAKIMSLELRFDQFWAQSDQKKSTFWTFEKFWQLPIEIWPNPKSGPFGQIWALKIWSWSLFIK